MLTSSQQPDRACSSSDALCVDEMEGWASVAEALMMDCARTALVDVAEPSARQTVESAYTDSLAAIVQRHMAATVALHQREVAQEAKLSDDLTRQLHALAQECDSMAEQLVSERSMRVALEEERSGTAAELQAVQAECEALQAERAAVWDLVRSAFESSPHRRRVLRPSHATLEDHVRYICGWLQDVEAEAEAAATAAAVAAAAAPPPPPQPAMQAAEEAPRSIFNTPRASYRRILPSAPLNPVTASLLRVKEQVQQLREPSVAQLQQAVGAYRPLREEGLATTPPARTRAPPTASAATASVTPLSVDRALGLSRSYTPHRTTASVVRSGISDGGNDGTVSSPPWRTHMAKLQEELKGLRRDLGTATPR